MKNLTELITLDILDFKINSSFIGKLLVILIVFPSKDILDEDIEVIEPTNKIKK